MDHHHQQQQRQQQQQQLQHPLQQQQQSSQRSLQSQHSQQTPHHPLQPQPQSYQNQQLNPNNQQPMSGNNNYPHYQQQHLLQSQQMHHQNQEYHHHIHHHNQGNNAFLARSNTFPMEQHNSHPQQQHQQHPNYQQQVYQQQQNNNNVPSQNYNHHHHQNTHYNSQQQQHSIHHQHPHHPQQQQQTPNSNSNATSPPVINGPRSKCDQVIYEAMTKACEIAVRGRCTDLVDNASMNNNYCYYNNNQSGDRGWNNTNSNSNVGVVGGRKTWNSPYPSSSSSYGNNTNNNNNNNGSNNSTNNNNTGSNPNMGSTSSRFNIEVDEVEGVRTILQRWKQSLHVPLRLDIYYEHDSCYDDDGDVGDEVNNNCGNDNSNSNSNDGLNSNGGENPLQPKAPPQRELLERWCIDYVPTSHPPNHGGGGGGMMTNDKSSNIAQLRQVCKRIVVLLRSLHCLTRILPAYKLKYLLLSHAASGGGIVGGATGGLSGGGSSEGWGSIGYSIYVSDYEPDAPALPSPAFTRQSFPNVPTPYGALCLSVMYDATLHPNHMVADLAERRTAWMEKRWMAQYPGQPLGLAGPEYVLREEGMTTQTGTMPIPIQQGRQASEPVVSSKGNQSRELMNGRRHFGSCPPATLMGGMGQYKGNPTSLGKSPAVSDYIIQDYHGDRSPSLKPISSPGGGGIGQAMSPASIGNNHVGDKRVMSGLSLAMMADEGNNQKGGQAKQLSHPSTPEEFPSDQDTSILRWQSSVTRAAFHHPPPTYTDSPVEEDEGAPNLTASQLQQAQSSGTADRTALNFMKQGTHFFQHHGGYGYGYNGSQVQLSSDPPPPPNSNDGSVPIRIGSMGTRTSSNNSPGDYGLSISPSPLMSTPPQTMWMKSRPPTAAVRSKSNTGNTGGEGANNGEKESSSYSSQGIAPPFQNPTTLQPLPSPSSTHGGSTSTIAHASAHGDPSTSGGSPHTHSALGKSGDAQRKRTSSSSSVLLPPVTSLDLLQKSPFSAARMHGAKSSTAGGEKDGAGEIRLDDDGLMMPFMLGSYRDDGFTSSIPRMVSASSRGRTGSFAGSMAGAASHSLMPSLDGGGFSASGGYYSTYYSSGAGGNIEPVSTSLEEMPFAVDDDPLMSGTSSPFGSVGKSSRSLLNGPNALDGTMNGVAEITSSLAVSSLHHRCGVEGKPRLKLFGSAQTSEGNGLSMLNGDGNNDAVDNDPLDDFASIKDQLSDFRNFAGSLMVGSIHDSRSE